MDLLLAGVLQDTWEEDARTVSISGPCDFAKFLPVSSITENLPMVAGLAWMDTIHLCKFSMFAVCSHFRVHCGNSELGKWPFWQVEES